MWSADGRNEHPVDREKGVDCDDRHGNVEENLSDQQIHVPAEGPHY